MVVNKVTSAHGVKRTRGQEFCVCGFQLGTDIRWVPGLEDYLIFSPKKSRQDSGSVADQQSEIKNLKKRIHELEKELKERKSLQGKLDSQMSKLKQLEQEQAELDPPKIESRRLRKVEKESYLKDHEISTLKTNIEYLNERNKELQETVAHYKQKEKEAKELNKIEKKEESERVKKLKSKNEKLEALFKQLRKQKRIAIASIDFLDE